MEKMIEDHHNKLVGHAVYGELTSLKNLKIFMEYHAYAVWDFMSLLKSIQNKVTCTTVPWRPSKYSPSVVRMINEIVLGEESDLDQYGEPCSHFELYLRAMEEVGANTKPLLKFIETLNTDHLPDGIREFIEHNLDMALNGRLEEVTSSFFHGREKLLPDIFERIVSLLKSEKLNCPTLIYYFERHIEVDGDSHGPLAQKCLDEICGDNQTKKLRALYAGIQALRVREKLWDATLKRITEEKTQLVAVL